MQKTMISTPTLFIHGYGGNYFSFSRLIRRFRDHHWASSNGVIWVTPHGKLIVWGNLSALVQVIFCANRSTVDDQTKWLWKILNMLKFKQKILAVNIVAHSMGCVSVLKYLTLFGNDNRTTNVQRVVTMGAPFNDNEVSKNTPYIEDYPLTEAGPIKESYLYHWFECNQFNLPLDIKFLNIAGDLLDGTHSDGQVAVDSVLALRYLIHNKIRQYREYVVFGKNAAHRKLHENHHIDYIIKQFLTN